METIDVTALGGSAALVMTIAMLVKSIIGAVKVGWDSPRWFAPTAALTLGPLLVLLAMWALGTLTGSQAAAGGILTGLVAGVTAVGVSAIQDGERHDAPNPTGVHR